MAKLADFKSGDLVRLVSGSPTMTVSEVNADFMSKDKVRCHWFGGRKLEWGVFLPDELVSVDPSQGENQR